jgi:hypothetical protein
MRQKHAGHSCGCSELFCAILLAFSANYDSWWSCNARNYTHIQLFSFLICNHNMRVRLTPPFIIACHTTRYIRGPVCGAPGTAPTPVPSPAPVVAAPTTLAGPPCPPPGWSLTYDASVSTTSTAVGGVTLNDCYNMCRNGTWTSCVAFARVSLKHANITSDALSICLVLVHITSDALSICLVLVHQHIHTAVFMCIAHTHVTIDTRCGQARLVAHCHVSRVVNHSLRHCFLFCFVVVVVACNVVIDAFC